MPWLSDGQRLAGLVRRWHGLPVVVVGDAVLDEWCHGEPDQLSREAPVPVVAVRQIDRAPGGAANAAVNVAALGAKPILVAPVGDDQEGDRLRQCLTEAGVRVRAVVAPGWTTPTKRRVVAGDQIVIRIDGGRRDALPSQAQRALVDAVAEELLSAPAAMALCDYGYGALGPPFLDWLRNRRGAVPIVAVDAHRLERWRDIHPTVVTPSFGEVTEVVHEAAADGSSHGPAEAPPDRPSLVERRARKMLEHTGAAIAAVTLDTDGAVVVGRDAAPVRTTTLAAPASHTVGAGDAYFAALTLSAAAGADLADSAELAQRAAAASISGQRTCVCRMDRLLAGLDTEVTERAHDVDELAARIRSARARGARVVFTNGCFDVLHRGHVGFLRQARSLGDVLVVAVNSDASVSRLKGPDRPVNRVEDRVAVLAGLSSVDYVVVFEEDTPHRLIEAIRPDIYVKGGDYRADLLPEAELVQRLGGKVRILDYVPDRSTSKIIERIRAHSVRGSSA